jgi:nicotinate phosphoribosyltransferase
VLFRSHAITIGQKLRERGSKLGAIRLDSGDLAWLSRSARALLDEAGLKDTQIVASNDLDEHIIESLLQQGAAIDAWGVGTKLATAYDEPALGGVYKLAILQPEGQGPAQPRIKLSEQASKVSTPGVLQVRRFHDDTPGAQFIADVIFDESRGMGSPCVMIDPLDPTRQRVLPPDTPYSDLLVPVWRAGQRVRPPEPLSAIQQYARARLSQLDPTVRRLLNPHEYPVGLDESLYDERMRLVKRARGFTV